MNTLRQAILLAADHCEQYPELYSYGKISVPDCKTTGCVVGWIGHFLGFEPGTICWTDNATSIIGVDSNVFTARMDAIGPAMMLSLAEPSQAALALRKYADMYHPEETHLEVETYPEINSELARIAAVSKVLA